MRILRILPTFSLAIIVAFIPLVMFALGGTKVITSGSYGPFTIGEDKSTSAATLERLGLWPPERALPPHRPSLEEPDITELLRVFGEDEGVMVFLDKPYGVPMRLEFEDDILTRMWPTFTPRAGSNPNPGYDAIDDAMLILQGEMSIGMSRTEAFDRIANTGSELKVFVYAHVAEIDQFRRRGPDDQRNDQLY